MRSVLSRTAVVVVSALALAVVLSAAIRTTARGAVSGITSPFVLFWDGFQTRLGTGLAALLGDGTEQRVRALEAEVRRLRYAAGEATELRRQNEELRAYYSLPPRPGWRVLLADVTARDPVTWNRAFRINRGAHDGVSAGAVVLSGAHVVGRVTEVHPGSALVRTIGDRGCRLSVVLSPSAAAGILEGTGSGDWRGPPGCVVGFLPKDVTAEVGDMVVTSGLGGAIPGGLPVGRVAAASSRHSHPVEIVQGSHARVTVTPLASFDRLRVVALYCPEQHHRATGLGSTVPPPPGAAAGPGTTPAASERR
ncbi:MAG: rod shape-determining protein MreC [Lentisphaeria bacterium]|nr:rod shape-determining protein MreC [Lentisphaeria bacterium]